MAADYDAPRIVDEDPSLDTIVLPRKTAKDDALETDDPEFSSAEGEGWGDINSDVVVIPLQASEFVCTGCFLMVDRMQLSPDHSHGLLCLDCAS